MIFTIKYQCLFFTMINFPSLMNNNVFWRLRKQVMSRLTSRNFQNIIINIINSSIDAYSEAFPLKYRLNYRNEKDNL